MTPRHHPTPSLNLLLGSVSIFFLLQNTSPFFLLVSASSSEDAAVATDMTDDNEYTISGDDDAMLDTLIISGFSIFLAICLSFAGVILGFTTVLEASILRRYCREGTVVQADVIVAEFVRGTRTSRNHPATKHSCGNHHHQHQHNDYYYHHHHDNNNNSCTSQTRSTAESDCPFCAIAGSHHCGGGHDENGKVLLKYPTRSLSLPAAAVGGTAAVPSIRTVPSSSSSSSDSSLKSRLEAEYVAEVDYRQAGVGFYNSTQHIRKQVKAMESDFRTAAVTTLIPTQVQVVPVPQLQPLGGLLLQQEEEQYNNSITTFTSVCSAATDRNSDMNTSWDNGPAPPSPVPRNATQSSHQQQRHGNTNDINQDPTMTFTKPQTTTTTTTTLPTKYGLPQQQSQYPPSNKLFLELLVLVDHPKSGLPLQQVLRWRSWRHRAPTIGLLGSLSLLTLGGIYVALLAVPLQHGMQHALDALHIAPPFVTRPCFFSTNNNNNNDIEQAYQNDSNYDEDAHCSLLLWQFQCAVLLTLVLCFVEIILVQCSGIRRILSNVLVQEYLEGGDMVLLGGDDGTLSSGEDSYLA